MKTTPAPIDPSVLPAIVGKSWINQVLHAFLGWKTLLLLCCLVSEVSADQFGDFTYSDDGFEISIDGYEVTAIGIVVIPASINGKQVTSIGDSAFSSCSGLTSVTIPASVTSIGNDAFGSCSGLTSLVIPPNVTSFGESVFFDCKSLTSVTIPPSITSLGDYTFYGCSSLTGVMIPSSVTSLGISIFYGCSSLVSVTIPTSVNSIGDYAFGACSSLTSITLSSNVTSFGEGVFSGCDSLTSVALPTTTTSIPESTFSGCSSLTSFAMPIGVTSIEDSAFSGCSGLVSVTIPTTVSSIGNSAFRYCSSLASIVIPNSVISIGYTAFADCSSLMNFSIPASITSIGYGAFDGCRGLTSINVAAANTTYSSVNGVLFNKTQTTLIRHPEGKTGSYTILAGVTSINDSAFSYCNLTSVAIPASVGIIDTFTFQIAGLMEITVDGSNVAYSSLNGILFNKNQTTLIQYPTGRIGSYTIPSSVTSIGNFEFSGCSLSSVTIPASVINIGDSPFFSCTEMTGITVDSTNTVYSSVNGVLFNKLQTTLIKYPIGKTGSYSIPATVTTFGDVAFDFCSNLTSVSIPASVVSMGDPFDHCTALTAITVADSNPVYSSVSGVLFNKIQTILIVYPGGKSGYYSIPSSVTSIKAFSFFLCSGLTGVTIPASVTSIGSIAFEGCSNLTHAIFSSNAPVMGLGVFDNTADGFTIYCSANASGFTFPEWMGYPTAITSVSNSPLQSWQINNFGNPLGIDAGLDFDADGDGLSNLLEYAFKLEPRVPNTSVLETILGMSGLPRLTPVGAGPSQRLRLEYVRKKASSNPGITYLPQFTSTLQGSGTGGWAAATGTEAVESIDNEWERVVVEDIAGTGGIKHFGRVMVTSP